MTAASTYSADRYTKKTLDRARRAMRCAPFTLPLYQILQEQGVALAEICGRKGVANGYATAVLAEIPAEDELIWLSVVGILRREVDGQGITDSFRLTPLGRILVAEWSDIGSSWVRRLSLADRVRNWLRRWVRVPY